MAALFAYLFFQVSCHNNFFLCKYMYIYYSNKIYNNSNNKSTQLIQHDTITGIHTLIRVKSFKSMWIS